MKCENCGLIGFTMKELLPNGKCNKCTLKEWEKEGGHI